MTGPLVVLGILSFIGGFIGLPAWIGSNKFFTFLEPSLELAHHSEHPHFSHSMEMGFAALSIAVAVIGIYLAYRLYVLRPGSAAALAERWKLLYRLLFRKYYVDEIYDATIVHPALNASTNLLWKRADVNLIDGIVNGTGKAIQGMAWILKGIQNGLIRSYAAWILLGTVAVLLYISLFRS